jgi:hypothetical protein
MPNRKFFGSDASLAKDAPYWQNGTPLYLDCDLGKQVFHSDRLDEFPLIEDFEVLLWNTENADFGYRIYFFSGSHGYVACFPWGDHAEADLLRENFRIPIGEFQRAFIDVEQGWVICIAARDNFVYIVQGNDKIPHEGFYAWFKVEKDLYLAAWQKTIDLCRSTFSD